jgi:Mg2+ and Co2+ transporter CorA
MEAQYASQLGSLSFQQNRSIMVFTIVTIVFLPLSFMSSVFGMNASDFDGPDGGNRMSLKAQFKLLCKTTLLHS